MLHNEATECGTCDSAQEETEREGEIGPASLMQEEQVGNSACAQYPLKAERQHLRFLLLLSTPPLQI